MGEGQESGVFGVSRTWKSLWRENSAWGEKVDTEKDKCVHSSTMSTPYEMPTCQVKWMVSFRPASWHVPQGSFRAFTQWQPSQNGKVLLFNSTKDLHRLIWNRNQVQYHTIVGQDSIPADQTWRAFCVEFVYQKRYVGEKSGCEKSWWGV